jgi:4-amino-4-deoxy-L-arabinose transferase-like glycosyltransferase
VKYNKSILNSSNFYTYIVIGILVLRLVLMSIVPLYDKTEARYAERARIMAETHNWITPQIDYNIPFWAKPPLSTWLSALSIELFGVNEFAVRLPYFLLSLILIVVLGYYVREEKQPFFLPGFILLTLPEFLLHAGVVSTDQALFFCVTLIMLSFWKVTTLERGSYWSYIFFIALGFGLLSKGPIVIILTTPPLVIWTLLFKKHLTLLNFPWTIGIIITLSVAVPWYYLAELHSKGFLDYFIVGEHFRRYFDSSWNGDKYGFPKNQPLGTIWVFLLLLSIPWIQLVLLKIWEIRDEIIEDKWVSFLLLWLLWTPVFFTVSRSLVHTYILPVMAPVSLLTVHFWGMVVKKKLVVGISLIFPIMILIVTGIALINNSLERIGNTDKFLMEGQLNDGIELFYLGSKSYSSQFYSMGAVKNISYKELIEKLNADKSLKVIIPNYFLKIIEPSELRKLKVISLNSEKKLYLFSLM